jgi:signal peptidase II
MMPRSIRLAVAGTVLLADRLSKYWIEQNVSAFDSHVVIPKVFYIIHAQNPGAAFGFMNQSEGPLRTFLLLGVSGAVLIYLAIQLWTMPRTMWPQNNMAAAALSMVLGGAMGNLIDRLWRGSVTDFLQFFIGSYEWPSFNVADSAISSGAVLLLLALWRNREPASA